MLTTDDWDLADTDLDEAAGPLAGLLREQMREATSQVEPPAGLAALVRARARRKTRRAMGAVAMTAAASLLAGFALSPDQLGRAAVVIAEVAGLRQDPADRDLYHRWWEQRPTGGLIGDGEYTQSVLDLWRRSRAESANADRGVFDNLIGQPVVVWAGSTPGGPAALVAQRAEFDSGSLVPDGLVGEGTVVGFVGVDRNGKPRMVADDYDPRTPMVGWFVDPDRQHLVVLDPGGPLAVSTEIRYRPDGTPYRDWSSLRFAEDGAAVVSAGTADPALIRIAQDPVSEIEHGLRIAGQWLGAPSADGRFLPWQGVRSAGGASFGCRMDEHTRSARWRALPRGELIFPSAEFGWQWQVCGSLTGQRWLLAGESVIDVDAGRLRVAIGEPDGSYTAVDAGPVREARLVTTPTAPPDQPGPLAAPLPDGAGTLVIDFGAQLRYRDANGWSGWTPDALVAPVSARGVEIRSVDGTRRTADL